MGHEGSKWFFRMIPRDGILSVDYVFKPWAVWCNIAEFLFLGFFVVGEVSFKKDNLGIVFEC